MGPWFQGRMSASLGRQRSLGELASAMRRRDFIGIVTAAATTGLFAAQANAEQVRRIGVLMGMEPHDPAGLSEVGALKQGLHELGWVEGRNLQIEEFWPGGQLDHIQASAKELVGLKCEVIVARTTPAVAAILKETRAIPIVFTYVFDPISSGFVQNFAQPGGNVTGFQVFEPTIVGKWLQILSEVAPSLRRIGFVYNPNTAPPALVHAFKAFAPSAPVPLIAVPAHEPAELDAAFAQFARQPGGGMIVVADVFTDAYHAQISALATKFTLPAIYAHRFDDALVTYGPDLTDLLRRASSYVDRILRGEKPGDLPVQAPSKYELIVNLRAAKAIGLDVPGYLQQLADEVID
jgi:putative ABC transport system substrate-binding protein